MRTPAGRLALDAELDRARDALSRPPLRDAVFERELAVDRRSRARALLAPGTSSSRARRAAKPRAPRHVPRLRGAAAVRRRDGLRRALPAADPSDRPRAAQGTEQHARCAARRCRAARGRSARPKAGTRRSIRQLGTLEDFRACVQRARSAGHRGRARHRVPVRAGPSVRRASTRSGSGSRPTAPCSTRRIRRRSTRTSIRSTSRPTTGAALWDELKSVFDVLDRRGRAHLPRRQPAHQAVRVLGVGDRRGQSASIRTSIFLSEAFTRPKSCTGSPSSASRSRTPTSPGATRRHELTEYFTELAHGPGREYFRPNVWPNTPDILPEYLQLGGRPAFMRALVLAATLARTTASTGRRSSCWSTRRASRAARSTSTRRSTSCGTGISSAPTASRRLHRAAEPHPRASNPALQRDWSLRFCAIDNDAAHRATARPTPTAPTWSLVVVNLDPHHAQSGWVDARPRTRSASTPTRRTRCTTC